MFHAMRAYGASLRALAAHAKFAAAKASGKRLGRPAAVFTDTAGHIVAAYHGGHRRQSPGPAARVVPA